MPRYSEEPARSAAQRRADFEAAEALRRELELRLAAIFEIWRDCERKPRQRSQRCTGASVATCLHKWSRAHIDDDTRTILHAMVKARAAGASLAEVEAVGERMEARIAATRAALAAGKSWHEAALAEPAGERREAAASEAATPPAEETEAGRAARIRALQGEDRLPRGVAQWTR